MTLATVPRRVLARRAAPRGWLRHPLAQTQLFELRTGLGGPTSRARAGLPAALPTPGPAARRWSTMR